TQLEQALADIEDARARSADRDELATRLTRVLAQLETAQTEGAERAAALEAELEQARRQAAETDAERASVEEKLLAALDRLERSEVVASDLEQLQARLLAALSERDTASSTARELLDLAEERAALLETARATLAEEEEVSAEAQRQTVLLNQQVAALREQLGSLQSLLDDYQARDAVSQVQLQNLGRDLNTALARAASEERKRRLLEEAEKKRLQEEADALAEEARQLEAQAKDLERYRSEFFGRLRDLLGTQEGVRIEGDRFVFSSEVLFDTGSANLSVEGQIEIGKVAQILRAVAREIPPEINWVIRVDGHTDNTPLFSTGKYSDNWELSQGRALSVVRYLVDFLGIPPNRLSANGFGEFQPVNTADTPEARAQNRRIELKLTER
ncbi:MAG: peptidoglycan -binding protein, partial [Pseudomonadota bacterium]